jgi:hypothetical protein
MYAARWSAVPAGDLVCTRPGPRHKKLHATRGSIMHPGECLQPPETRTTDKDARPSISRRTHIVTAMPASHVNARARCVQLIQFLHGRVGQSAACREQQRRFVVTGRAWKRAGRARRAMNIRPAGTGRGAWLQATPFTGVIMGHDDVDGLHIDDPCPSYCVNYW